MIRSFKQMVDAALDQRRSLIREGKEPTDDGTFECTLHESLVLKMQPWPAEGGALNEARDRLCGLKVVIA